MYKLNIFYCQSLKSGRLICADVSDEELRCLRNVAAARAEID